MILGGQAIWIWNIVQSWYEAPTTDNPDPWNLKASNQFTHEWRWNERRMETAIADGGEQTEGLRTSEDERSESSGSEEGSGEETETAVTDGGHDPDGDR